MSRSWIGRLVAIASIGLCISVSGIANGEEVFVTIQRVTGNRLLIVKDTGIERGGMMQGGMRGGMMRGGGFNGAGGRRGRGARISGTVNGSSANSAITVTIPSTAKITSAMRERRTFEFRVLNELPGGLRHNVFKSMRQPLKARIVTKDNVIMELNVITGETDINQSGNRASGESVIAVRPKRPPMKRTSGGR
ncbi:MAG: hypothetical protein AAGI63_15395 [Planctomycetota bacterium]